MQQLKRQIKEIESRYAEERQKLKQVNAPAEKFQQLEFSMDSAIEEIGKQIDWIESNRLSRKALSLDVVLPPRSDTEMWQRVELDPKIRLTQKGRAHVRKLIHEEWKRRAEDASRWIPLLSVVLAIIGTITSLVALTVQRKSAEAAATAAGTARISVELARKQMEGVSAAMVELRQAVPYVSVNPPPAGSEVRFSFTNSGHIIAHNVHVEFTATLSSVEHPTEEKVLITGNETIPQLPPATANAYVPDKIFTFEMSASEAKRITDTYDDFIVVKGSFTYENGFGTLINEPFCNGHLWGPSGIGRQFPRCEDIPVALNKLREEKKR